VLTNEIALDIQHVRRRLHASKLHYPGIAAAVRELCQEFSQAPKIEVECVVEDVPPDLGEGTSVSLFGTVQESLDNVAKHSSAHRVKVDLSGGSTGIYLRISDDGVGFDDRHRGDARGLGRNTYQATSQVNRRQPYGLVPPFSRHQGGSHQACEGEAGPHRIGESVTSIG
jgi:signal transduction histidine kinase